MAFTFPRAGQSALRRKFHFQLRFSASAYQLHHQHRHFSQTQLNDIPTKKLQIYRSTSSDPYINLSIEHHLLQHTPPDSTILFLYINRPCVVIGRNQNPWYEINLDLLRGGLPSPEQKEKVTVDIVRRRSGGGTVFHDQGNVNWSVICPPPSFNRDKHAEMVVRALKKLSVEGTPRVNERHDIVLDVDVDNGNSSSSSTFKISGSAYKLTRNRSLHHGTCLLSSPFLRSISGVLRSPAAAYIKTNGVPSVRSPVRNVGIENEEFVAAVVDEFREMYAGGVSAAGEGEDVLVHENSALEVENIRKGVAELRSLDWIYGQSPLFTFSTHPTEEDPRPRPPLPEGLPEDLQIFFSARHGQIDTKTLTLKTSPSSNDPLLIPHDQQNTNTLKLQDITSWEDTLTKSATPSPTNTMKDIARWLDRMFVPLPLSKK